MARRAGVGATTLYRHFAGKEELIEAVLDDLVAVRERAARTAVSGITVADIAAFVRMTVSADAAESRGQAIDTILDCLTRTG